MTNLREMSNQERIEIFSSATVGQETFIFPSEENLATNARIAYPLASVVWIISYISPSFYSFKPIILNLSCYCFVKF